MRWQEVLELPAAPPELLVNGAPVAPYAVDWRTGEVTSVSPPESVDFSLPQVPGGSGVAVELTNSVRPSDLSVGMYPKALKDVDPLVPPDAVHDCLTESVCAAVVSDGTVKVSLDGLLVSPQAVITITAMYFAEVDGVPSANTVHWAFEVTE